ncbi:MULTISPECIES: hypothetical protein [Bacillus]|uniref:YbfE n=1 Tax=Bacillus subtilis TaxID=1423 RepID=A0AAP2LZY1_BACIU|nr:MULTISPECIES: hypothetical protein [Bacillus]ASZ60008.1 hypothetical protein CLD04_01670 [Bacillus subtilis]AYK66227.1 hypothetical protein D9C11_12560 [Bacillus subtilis subsp. subtilis]KIN27060.1 hypothetical protein B4069_0261 [Bacillus subtilis]KIN32972.1 hypothetical protein B4068_0344 [Bacillus subtilis]KIN39855.1 hypothetical protein B4070_0237 [Bacillus subtilis]
MTLNQQTFKETVKMAETIKQYKENDKEILTFLTKQDSIMLNQLKVFFSEPQLTLIHSIKTVIYGTLVTLFLYFTTNELPHAGSLLARLFFVVVGFIWLASCFKNAKAIQVSQNFKQKSENARIVGMIDFVLEQKYKKSISE